MRLTLVERQEARLRCIPDLGIAHLAGQCRKAGIGVSLVQGSPLTLECLTDRSVFPLFLRRYGEEAKERGEDWLGEFLEFNWRMAVSSDICDKANPEALRDLWELLEFVEKRVWPEWLAGFLHDRIMETRPDSVGFSVWDFYGHPEVAASVGEVVRRLRKEEGLPVLVGGPGTVTRTARRDILRIFEPDAIVHHEGELALPGALEMIEGGGPEKAPNISVRGSGGGLRDGETVPVEDLDSLALPDFTDYDLDSFFLPVRVLPVMTSRGCPWARCAFCSHHATYRGYREFSPERVAEAVDMCREKHGAGMIMLHDETVTAARVRALLPHLPEADYYSYAYPKGFDAPLLKRMREKGFRVLVWGVESGCQEVLDRMRKGTDTSEVERIIRASHDAGITNVAFILFGFPGETRKQAEETVDFLRRNAGSIERHAATVFRLEEGSPVWREPGRWGVKKLKGGDYRVESGMRREEVLDFLRGLNERRIKTSADTKYYMPGDSEMRPYLFMQAAYGEGSGEYPVRNGLLIGNEIRPSLLMKGVSRPVLKLDERQKELYLRCDGRHKADAGEFLKYPYVVMYERPFGG